MIKNLRNKKTVEYEVDVLNNEIQWMKGLMFSKPKTLVFDFHRKRIVRLHMLFVFYPIDVIYLNEKKEVTSYAVLYPFISLYSAKAAYVIETIKGTIKKLGIKKGDKIEWS